jgi:hypothetical protein
MRLHGEIPPLKAWLNIVAHIPNWDARENQPEKSETAGTPLEYPCRRDSSENT